MVPWLRRRSSASASATKAPVMEALRVPPSAWITSQSTQSVRSPSAFMSTTARSERPMRRWISWVRPEAPPRDTSRCERVLVARGSMPYSEVTQPSPLPLRNVRHALLDAHRADDLGVAHLDEGRAFGVLVEGGRDRHGAQRVVAAADTLAVLHRPRPPGRSGP